MTRADVRLLKRNRAWRSKLTPYEDLIRKLRRRGKSYREIAKRLREVHGVEISHNGVYSFVKARKRHQLLQMPEPFGYAACCGIVPENPAPPTTPHRKPPVFLNESEKEIPSNPWYDIADKNTL
jgi:hypothetical protein